MKTLSLALIAALAASTLAVPTAAGARDWHGDRHHGWKDHHRHCWTEWHHHHRVTRCR